MADGGTTQLAVQAEQRHQVDGCQCVGWRVVQIREVRRVEARGGHQVGVQRAVHKVLAHLLPAAGVAQMMRRAPAVHGLH
jgi:hypothetical protein